MNFFVKREKLQSESESQIISQANDNISIEQAHNPPENVSREAATRQSHDVMFKTLCDMGCQPKTNEHGHIEVMYQGEYFIIEFSGRFGYIHDYWWRHTNVADPDLPEVKEAINRMNSLPGITLYMTSPDEDGDIGIHIHRDVLLHPSFPETLPYIQNALDSFFRAQNYLRRFYNEIVDEKEMNRKTRRSVGFITSQ